MKHDNNHFWEELIAYVNSYDTDRMQNNASTNSSIFTCVSVAAVTFLPSHCLETLEDRHRMEEFMKYAVEMGSGALIYTYGVTQRLV
jgi:hypothetical protein